MDEGAWIEAGLYDPAAVGAQERLELLAFLTEQGCSVDEMVVAHSKGRLFALAGDRLIRPDRDRYDLHEVAEIVGQPVERVRALWRAFGLVDVGDKVASPDDVEMLRTSLAMVDTLGLDATIGLARVMGSSLARIGDAVSAAVRSRFPSMSISSTEQPCSARKLSSASRSSPPAAAGS